MGYKMSCYTCVKCGESNPRNIKVKKLYLKTEDGKLKPQGHDLVCLCGSKDFEYDE